MFTLNDKMLVDFTKLGQSNLDILTEGITSEEDVDTDSIATDAPTTNKEIKSLDHLEEKDVD